MRGTRGWIWERVAKDGSKRYDACWRTADKKIKSRTFRLKKKAAQHLAEHIPSVQDGTYVDVRPTRMAEVFDRWLEHRAVKVKEGTLKRSTLACYRSVIVRHLRPALGHVRSDGFTLGVVEQWRAGVAAQVAAGTMYWANIRNVLHAVLAWARHPDRRYLAHDPLAGLEPLPRSREKTRPHFELEQVAALLALAARTPPDDTILKVAAFSGLRRGELFALPWSDVDPGNGRDGGCLHVRRSIYHGEITAPKTEDSARAVDVPQQLLDDLAVYKLTHPPIGEGFIFRQEGGQPLDPDSWHQRRLIPILEAAGLRLHVLRERGRVVAHLVGDIVTSSPRPAWRRCGGSARRSPHQASSSKTHREPSKQAGTGRVRR